MDFLMTEKKNSPLHVSISHQFKIQVYPLGLNQTTDSMTNFPIGADLNDAQTPPPGLGNASSHLERLCYHVLTWEKDDDGS
jgi:hypothetical protein